jgi:propionyl-CoA synthetase
MNEGDYAELYRRSMVDPAGFWADAASAIDWTTPWTSVLSQDHWGAASWFAGGTTNTCWNALDRHVAAGHGGRLALIYDSPVTGQRQRFTYSELTARVAKAAGMLRNLGVSSGDRIMVYMPAIPEALISMLACARIGAVHAVVFGGFAAPELASRIRDCRPKVLLAASCGIEGGHVLPYKPAVDAAIALAPGIITACVIVQRSQCAASIAPGVDHDWDELMTSAAPVGCVAMPATDPLYILYTSGTTGRPKGVVRPIGGHLVAIAWSMPAFYDVHSDEVMWTASDVGWQVGHSYTVYGPLINGSTTLLYEGKPVGTPDAGAFWRVIEEYRVVTLLTAPTALRVIRRDDPDAALLRGRDTSSLRAIFLAGERCDPTTIRWIERVVRRPVIDHWWQTESGWPIAGNPLGIQQFPTRYGSVTKPMPGWNVRVLDDAGSEVPHGETGSIVCKLPLPPGAATTLWGARERYADAYLSRYPGYYLTGDAGFFDGDGYLSVMTRIDDVINVAGHRLSTGALEEVIAEHPAVAECAVVGLEDGVKGQVPLGFAVLRSTVQEVDDIVGEVIRHVRHSIGAIASLKQIVVVARLPKTRSGKILRSTLANMVNGHEVRIPPTIDDASVLEDVREVLLRSKVGKSALATRPQGPDAGPAPRPTRRP